MIIAITGTNGAGKGAVADYLAQSHGFFHVSAREFLAAEIERRGIAVNRDSMIAVADDLRKNREPKNGFVALELLRQAEAHGGDAVIESVRTLEEIRLLREARPEILIWAVDGDSEARYQRALARKSATDHVSYAEFLRQEKSESEGKESWRANLPACIRAADKIFMNNGTKEKLVLDIENELSNA